MNQVSAPNDDNDDGIEVEEDSLSSNIDTVITNSDCEAPEKYFKDDLVLPNKKNRTEDNYTSQNLTSGNTSVVDVRIIDFAHTTFAPKAINSTVTTKTVKVAPTATTKIHLGPDNGFLTGLNSLTRILSEILFEHYQEK